MGRAKREGLEKLACKSCGDEHPATPEYFVREGKAGMGIRALCHECKRAQNRRYNARYLAEIAARKAAKKAELAALKAAKNAADLNALPDTGNGYAAQIEAARALRDSGVDLSVGVLVIRFQVTPARGREILKEIEL